MSKRSPKLSASPSRGTFGSKGSADLFDEYINNKKAQESDPAWAENNLEYDLRTTDWILKKTRDSEVYAQHLYAALCNNGFERYLLPNTEDNLMDVLKSGLPKWSCSWRHAGGIIADMREEGDYIDWYCSGNKSGSLTEKEIRKFTKDQLARYKITQQFVGEGQITDEILEDLRQLGWTLDPNY